MCMSSFMKLGCSYVHLARKCLVINPKYSLSPLLKLLPRHNVIQSSDTQVERFKSGMYDTIKDLLFIFANPILNAC